MGHLASVHGERVQCDECDFQAYPYERVARHQIMKHNICQTCGDRFANSQILEAHCENVHKKRMPESMAHSFKCQDCEYYGKKYLHLEGDA